MAERRILVIDDDKLIHAVIRAALAKGGYQVHSAFDSVQAAGAARQIKPAALDWFVPATAAASMS